MSRRFVRLTCIICCLLFLPLIALARPTKAPGWVPDAANAAVPNIPAIGRLNGSLFTLDQAELVGNTLELREGKDFFGKLIFSIDLPSLDYGEKLDGKVILVHDPSDDFPSPPTVWKEWKPSHGSLPLDFACVQHYTMRLEFGTRHGEHLPGAIYLCAKDASKSYVVGHFNAALTRGGGLRVIPLK